MKPCGIDLGTTNSCIYVVEPDGPRLIRDEHRNETFPSVVYLGKDGHPAIGHSARNRMGELPGPVATIKRRMGSSERVAIGKETKTPVEISAMILRFLKELAEKTTGEEIDRAVVTVPAYFAHIQRQHTDEAAKAAGFREVHTLLEPVAAALAYSLESDRENLRVFVYDLGGGTFDATVLEKDDQGGLSVLSFGGDPYLGGDDLDSRIAQLLLQKLAAKGYKLDLKLDAPADYSRFQRLKFHAETAKKELTKNESWPIVHHGLFEDQDGETVDLDVIITREELENCTADLIERSIKESLATLEKNNLAIDSIDEIIMVGGMSRMPLVRRRLAEAFGREPKLVDPDLIVAKGAALKAAQIFSDRASGAGGLTLDLRYDRETDKARVRIAGVFDRIVIGHTVYLIDRSEERYERLARADRFAFENVPLTPSSENVFTITVEDAAGETVLEREFKIRHDPRGARVISTPGAVVTKAISIWTLDGARTLFAENTPLPHFSSCTFETADQTGQIIMPVMEGNHEVERLIIREIPTSLAVGTVVLVEVSVEADYTIAARASVPSIARSIDVCFHIDAVDTANLGPDKVRARLTELDAEATKVAANCPSPDEVEIFRLRFKAGSKEVAMELSEPEPNRLKIHEKLGALALMIRNVSQRGAEIQLKPPYEEFSRDLLELETSAIEKRHPKLAEVRPRIENLRAEGERAWRDKDKIAWARAVAQIPSIAQALMPQRTPTEWAELLAGFVIVGQVPEMKAAAKGRFSSEIEAIQADALATALAMQMNAISPETAADQLMQLYRQRVVPLRNKLGLDAPEPPAQVPSIPPAGKGHVRMASN